MFFQWAAFFLLKKLLRKAANENSSFTRFALNMDRYLVKLHDMLDDRKSKPRASQRSPPLHRRDLWRSMSLTIITIGFMTPWLKIARSRGLQSRFSRAGESSQGRDSVGFIIAMSGRKPPEVWWSENLLQVGFTISFGTGCFCPNLIQDGFGRSDDLLLLLFYPTEGILGAVNERFCGRIFSFLSLRDIQGMLKIIIIFIFYFAISWTPSSPLCLNPLPINKLPFSYRIKYP